MINLFEFKNHFYVVLNNHLFLSQSPIQFFHLHGEKLFFPPFTYYYFEHNFYGYLKKKIGIYTKHNINKFNTYLKFAFQKSTIDNIHH